MLLHNLLSFSKIVRYILYSENEMFSSLTLMSCKRPTLIKPLSVLSEYMPWFSPSIFEMDCLQSEIIKKIIKKRTEEACCTGYASLLTYSANNVQMFNASIC